MDFLALNIVANRDISTKWKTKIVTDSKDYDGLRAVSSGCTLFAYMTLLVFKVGSVKLVLVAANHAIFFLI